MSSKEKVIELSVAETNQLRAQLGLAPLRVSNNNTPATQTVSSVQNQNANNSNDNKVLELSIEESNTLRQTLGLAPLRHSSRIQSVVHAPAVNETEQKRAAERIQQAKLRRQVDEGIQQMLFTSNGLAEQTSSAKSWAAQMRSGGNEATKTTTKSTTKSTNTAKYDEDQLKGMNVAHSISELQEGSTTVLTLADAPLLATKDDTSQKVVGLNEDQVQLENVTLAEARKVSQGLKEKRKLELGMGRAGGYAGFDDDEFEELGGTQGPSRLARGPATGIKVAAPRGFQIGAHLQEQEEELQSDLFAAAQGKSISLEYNHADVTATDFMTLEEDEAMKQERKKKKKDAKFKKSKKKSKKDKKKSRRREESDDETGGIQVVVNPQSAVAETATKKGLLDELEETATVNNVLRKRRRAEDEDDTKLSRQAPVESSGTIKDRSHQGNKVDPRARYDAIMDKGNARTRNAFGSKSVESHHDIDEEPDDAFLNAALAKARRLNRLKALSKPSQPRGADAVVDAIRSAQNGNTDPSVPGAGTIEFTVDETREFTRALRARKEQTERIEVKTGTTVDEGKNGAGNTNVKVEDVPMGEADLHELAKEVKEEPLEDAGLDGTTGSTAPIGRGLGNVLNYLKQTGELTRKNAGREELRGRARDKKTYEDYEAIPLSDFVKIDERTATEKDREFANREIKLEYRDKHGRLMTRKEAFRDLSYQFHGHGSGKRKEEKRLQQIEQEQAATRFASRQSSEGASAGTFGALKATQQATGKAFVVHKT